MFSSRGARGALKYTQQVPTPMHRSFELCSHTSSSGIVCSERFSTSRVSSSNRLCAARRTGPFSRTVAAGALRRADTAVRSVNEADTIYYLK